MPRPIPDNPELIDGWRYYLVALPDNDDAIAAGWDIFSNLMNDWEWGEEGIEPDSAVMAQKWADAIYETIRIRAMGFPDDVLTNIDDIESKLDDLIAKDTCCEGEAITDSINDGGLIAPIQDDAGSDIVRGEGDPPGGVVDWATYDQRLCEAALNYANNLDKWAQALEALSAVTTLGLALTLAGLVGGLGAVGIAGAAAIGAMGVLEALGFLERVLSVISANPSYDDAITELQSAATIDAVACAIVLASTPAEAETDVDGALLANAPSAYALFEPWPLRFTMNKLFNMESDAGGFGGASCNCGYDVDVTFTFDADTEGWALSSRAAWNSSGYLELHPKSGSVPNPVTAAMGLDDLRIKAGEASELAWSLRVLEIETFEDPSFPGYANARTLECTVRYTDDTEQVLTPTVSADGTYTFAGFDPTKAMDTTAGGEQCLWIKVYHNGNSSNGVVFVDNVRVAANVI